MNALVLSAGGMFGAYQAGAWQALAPRFQPELIVGASIGAVNGYLIASGVDADELAQQWTSLDQFSTWRFRPHWNPLEGMVDAAPLEGRLRDICARIRPRMPLAIVATDLFALRPSVFCDSEITWRHLAASCAVFCLLPQYRLGGRRHTDGGVLGALPVWAARQLGATHVVAIHLLPRPPAALRATRRLLHAIVPFARDVDGVVTTIAPSRPLGRLRDAALWRRSNAEQWIELGRRDAAAAILA